MSASIIVRSCQFLYVLLLMMPTYGYAGVSMAQDAFPPPKLIIRYVNSTGAYRIEESIGEMFKVNATSDDKIGIRFCSQEISLKSFLTAPTRPLLIANSLVNRAYPSDNIIFLFSKGCIDKTLNTPVTEVWTIPMGASFPENEFAVRFSEISFEPLGKNINNRGMQDYKRALKHLIRELKRNKDLVGIIQGYFITSPSAAMRKNLKKCTKTLSNHKIPKEQFLAFVDAWPGEVSISPPDTEPIYPNIYIFKVPGWLK